MSGTVSSAELILRRVYIYLEDADYILHHEVLTNTEKCDIEKLMSKIEIRCNNIMKLVDISCGL